MAIAAKKNAIKIRNMMIAKIANGLNTLNKYPRIDKVIITEPIKPEQIPITTLGTCSWAK